MAFREMSEVQMKPNEQKTIELFLRACPTEAVRDIAETPEEGWTWNQSVGLEGRRCLVGIAAGMWISQDGDMARWGQTRELSRDAKGVAETFDTCCKRDGLSATVEEVRRMARGVLADRSAKL